MRPATPCFRLVLPGLLLGLALAACGSTTPPADPAGPAPAAGEAAAPALLAAHHWQLREARDAAGRPVPALAGRADRPVQLDFADGRLVVSNTCNRMSGRYRIEDGVLVIERLVSTLMACPDPALMALDRELGTRLEGRPHLALEDGGPPRLVLATAAGERLVFAGRPTAATRYGGEPERIFLEVAAEIRPCEHPLMGQVQCLQVRRLHYDERGLAVGDPGPWENFSGPIEGYRHQPGVRNVLRVDRYVREPAPADASRYAYVLDMVVESKQVAP